MLQVGRAEIDGVLHHAIQFDTVDGVGYDVEISTDLQTWSVMQSLLGFGNSVTVPLIEVGASGGGGSGGGGPGGEFVFLTLEDAAGGGALASWNSVYDGRAVQHHLPGIALGPGWHPVKFYAGAFGGYEFAILGTTTANASVPPNLSALGVSDAAMIDILEQNFSTIDAEVGAQSGNLPLSPAGGQGSFVRVVADYERDSDSDGIPDVVEMTPVAQGGTATHRFNADTDGDLVFDGAEAAQETDPNDQNDTPTENVPTTPPGSSLGVVKEVAFWDHHKIKSDNDKTSYSRPQWRSGSHNYPVPYTKNDQLSLGAKFLMPGVAQGTTPPPKVRAKTNVPSLRAEPADPESLALPETELVSDGVAPEWNLANTQCNGTLPDSIKYYSAQEAAKEFELIWEISDGGGWVPVGTTKHTVYLGLRNPVTPEQRITSQETLWNIACRNADTLGGGLAIDPPIADAVYSEFVDRKVARVKPTQGTLRNEVMTYYKNPDPTDPCNTVRDFLARDDGNGNCRAWALAFIDSLHLIGIGAQWVWITPKTSYGDRWFAIKTPWTDPTAPKPDPTYEWRYPHSIADLAPDGEILGMPGQGGEGPPPFDPMKLFGDHHLAQVESAWYDPSYGTPKIADADEEARMLTFENTYIFAFGKAVSVDVPEISFPVEELRFRENTAGPVEIEATITAMQKD